MCAYFRSIQIGLVKWTCRDPSICVCLCKQNFVCPFVKMPSKKQTKKFLLPNVWFLNLALFCFFLFLGKRHHNANAKRIKRKITLTDDCIYFLVSKLANGPLRDKFSNNAKDHYLFVCRIFECGWCIIILLQFFN